MLLIFWLVGRWVCFIRNKTIVIGRENLPKGVGFSLYMNHQSLIDSLLVLCSLYTPMDIIFRFRTIPWSVAAWENFFKKPSRRFFCRFLKVIPAFRGSELKAANQAVKEYNDILKTGVLSLFFEGTRSRSGKIGECRYGPAKLIADHNPKTIPIRIDGMDKVMPISVGFKWLKVRGGNLISLKVGKEMKFTSLDIKNIRRQVKETVEIL